MRAFVPLLVLCAAASTVTSQARAEVVIGLAAPLTGELAWAGAATQQGAAIAVADLNAKGGVLGEHIQMVSVDDFCSADQALAAARKLVEVRVAAVFGHECSSAAIAASRIYAEADLLMISNFATNPKLTEQGFTNVFRVIGRDDAQGGEAAELLVERFREKRIAILHDGDVYGSGLAAETRKRLRALGMKEVVFKALDAEELDYTWLIQELQEDDVHVVYYAGYPKIPALMMREAHDRRYDLQLVSADTLSTADFGLIAGSGAAGALFTYPPQPPTSPSLAKMADQLEPELDLQSAAAAHAAVEAWAQAGGRAGTLEGEAVARTLRENTFDTVLGTIGFDARGDVTGYDSFAWYIWQDGEYVPLEPASRED